VIILKMNRLIILILLLFSLKSQASDLDGWVFYSWVAGVTTFAAIKTYDYRYSEDINQHGVYISYSLDPKIALKYVKLDHRAKISILTHRIEIMAVTEYLGNPFYYRSISSGINYEIWEKELSILTGPEISKIWNENKDVISYGWNIEWRYILSDRWSLSYIGNFKTRPELTSRKWIYNGYIGINIKL